MLFLQIRKVSKKEVKYKQLLRGLIEIHTQIYLAPNGTPLSLHKSWQKCGITNISKKGVYIIFIDLRLPLSGSGRNDQVENISEIIIFSDYFSNTL